MKRQKVLEHLRIHGCTDVREGGNHTTVCNPTTRRFSRVPRHREIKPGLVRAICRQLGIPLPSER
jgi:predicted RNA binding protein YcfA (HicA-like mRNA interferase family)